MRRVLERCRWLVVLWFVLIFGSMVLSPRVFADGGAPNLAYVAGTLSGVSVIDVGQGKVTKTIDIAGEPRMILLSPDGRFLSNPPCITPALTHGNISGIPLWGLGGAWRHRGIEQTL